MSLDTKLRRIALDRQGLLAKNPFGRGKQAVLRAIEHLGYVQIDTISVVERAHHHVLWARVGSYRPQLLDTLVRERKLFEYWYHAAAWLPMRDFRFALPRMSQLNGERHWLADCDRRLRRRILDRIRAEGPLRARDFGEARPGNSGWWDWKPAKLALEQLFMQGELMSSSRDGFQKVYDLPERVLPDWVDTRMPSLSEYASYLIDTTLRSHGFASAQSMTYLRKGRLLRTAVGEELARRVADRELVLLDAGNGRKYHIDPESLESRAPRCVARVGLLSPFDNAVIQRQRARDLFDFDYQIECYVPGPKRRYGYFCLPLQYRDRFAGRIDCKAHRKDAVLEIRRVHIERNVDDGFGDALCRALREFAAFNGCSRIENRDPDADSFLRALS